MVEVTNKGCDTSELAGLNNNYENYLRHQQSRFTLGGSSFRHDTAYDYMPFQ